MGQVVFGSRLCGGQANGRGKGTDHGAHAGFVHLFNFGRARLRAGLRIAQHGFDLGAAQRLDATGLVDVFNGHQGAHAALLTRVSQSTRHRVQNTHFDGLGLSPAHQWKGESRGRSSGLAHESAT